MAKSQKRSSREAKKPKQEKKAAPVTAPLFAKGATTPPKKGGG